MRRPRYDKYLYERLMIGDWIYFKGLPRRIVKIDCDWLFVEKYHMGKYSITRCTRYDIKRIPIDQGVINHVKYRKLWECKPDEEQEGVWLFRSDYVQRPITTVDQLQLCLSCSGYDKTINLDGWWEFKKRNGMELKLEMPDEIDVQINLRGSYEEGRKRISYGADAEV